MAYVVPWLFMIQTIPIAVFTTSTMVRGISRRNTRCTHRTRSPAESTVITLADW